MLKGQQRLAPADRRLRVLPLDVGIAGAVVGVLAGGSPKCGSLLVDTFHRLAPRIIDLSQDAIVQARLHERVCIHAADGRGHAPTDGEGGVFLRRKNATLSGEGVALPAKAAFLVTFQTEMSWAKDFAS